MPRPSVGLIPDRDQSQSLKAVTSYRTPNKTSCTVVFGSVFGGQFAGLSFGFVFAEFAIEGA
jgi:hypothetical protein